MERENNLFCYAEYKEVILGIVVKWMKEKINLQLSFARFNDKSSFAEFYIRYSTSSLYNNLLDTFHDNGFDRDDCHIYARAARKELLLWLEEVLDRKLEGRNINWFLLREEI